MTAVRVQMIGFFKIIILAMMLSSFTGINTYPNTAYRHAMLRLEDVGPGGYYATEESLGQLRAVMDMLNEYNVPYHVAVIPHWIQRNYEKGLDTSGTDPYLNKFIHLLQTAEKQGAVLGMHGYTHQYGSPVQEGVQESAIGREFKVAGAPKTYEASYAAERIEKSWNAFQYAGLHPAFWESPHYKDTMSQEAVLRSYVGILYEPDFTSIRSLSDIQMHEEINRYGAESLGSVYVPAPLKYIHDGNSVEDVLKKAKSYTGLASLYYHPMLEFSYLERVTAPDGQTLMYDDLPVYHYKAGALSPLRRLITGMGQEGFSWVSLSEVIPFIPAHRVQLGVTDSSIGAVPVLVGDFTGGGHVDVAIQHQDSIQVIDDHYDGARNRSQTEARVWLQHTYSEREQWMALDLNGDAREDLLIFNMDEGNVKVCYSTGHSWLPPLTIARLPAGLKRILPLRTGSGASLAFAAEEGTQLNGYAIDAGGGYRRLFSTPLPTGSTWKIGHFQNKLQDDLLMVSADGSTVILTSDKTGHLQLAARIRLQISDAAAQVVVMDTDGDGLSDITVYDSKLGVWQVYRNVGGLKFNRMDHAFGPWARGIGRIAIAADFDGNGKDDIASFDPKQGVLDIALSFQRRVK